MEVLQRTANRGSISTGYDIDNSLKIEEDNAEHMTRTYSEAGVKTKGTISFWHKRSEIQSGIKRPVDCADGSGNNSSGIFIDGHRLCFDFGGGGRRSLRANALMRDTAAWYHLMATWDTSQGTASNRAKIYINGEQVTDLHEATYPDQNMASQFFTNTGGGSQVNKLFCQNSNTSNHPSGYFAEFNYVNNAQLTPTDFGEFDEDSGIWKPKKYTGSYGDTGFYLDFADAADLGDDESGNGNDWTEVNITAADQATDTPTNNFCTWNPLVTNAGVFTYADGATKWKPSSGNWQTTTASMGFTKGKWYAEFKMDSNVTAAMVGVQQLENDTTYSGQYLGYYANTTSMGMGYYNADGKVYRNTGESAYGASYSSSVLVSVALEFKDDGTANMYVAKDGTWQNSADPANGTGGFGLNYGSAVDGFFSFAASLYQNPGYWQANFGGYTVNSISSAASDANGYGTFEYAPPSGYYALCTKNLAEYG